MSPKRSLLQRISRVCPLAALTYCLLSAATVEGATILYRTTEQLVVSSERIVHGRVVGVRTVRGEGQRIYTVTTLAVIEDVTGGNDSTIEMWELGGAVGTEGLHVTGAVRYSVGEEVVVMLERGRRGWRAVAMGFSSFDVAPQGVNDAPLQRRLADAVVVGTPVAAETAPRLSELRALAVRLKGAEPRRFARVETRSLDVRVEEKFTTLGDGRWTQADTGTPVLWLRNTVRASPLLSGNTDGEINLALAAWTNPPSGSIILQHGGTTSQADPVGPFSNVGVITFDDPLDDVPGDGVLALGGFFYTGSPGSGGTFNGRGFLKIVSGYVIFQRTAELSASFRQTPDFTRVLQHEIGHGIGFGHTQTDGSVPNATSNIMYPECCFSNMPRPPNIGPDDLALLNFIYPAGSTPAPPPQCSFSLSPASASAPAVGRTGTVALTASASSCAWTASSNSGFLSITSPASGTGSATITYSVARNTRTSDRTAILTIAGRVFTLRQAGVPPAFDLDGDNRLDLLWHHQTTGDIAGWLMDGTDLISGTLLTPSAVADTTWKVVGAGDLDGDGQFDLVWQNADGRIAAWLMDGLTLRQGALFSVPEVADTNWRIRSVGDSNNDGKADLFWQHEGTGDIAVWLMNGLTVTTGTTLTPSNVSDLAWKIVGTADFDGNGSRDLVWHHQTTGDIAIWFMNGTSLMSGSVTHPAQVGDLNWKIRAVGDLNNDGRPDLLWQNTADGSIAVWLMNGLDLIGGTVLNPSQVPDTNWHIVGPR